MCASFPGLRLLANRADHRQGELLSRGHVKCTRCQMATPHKTFPCCWRMLRDAEDVTVMSSFSFSHISWKQIESTLRLFPNRSSQDQTKHRKGSRHYTKYTSFSAFWLHGILLANSEKLPFCPVWMWKASVQPKTCIFESVNIRSHIWEITTDPMVSHQQSRMRTELKAHCPGQRAPYKPQRREFSLALLLKRVAKKVALWYWAPRHTTSTYCGGWCHRQVLHFKDHPVAIHPGCLVS